MGKSDVTELREQMIAELLREHAAATKTNILTGNEKVLHDLGNDLGDRLNQPGVSEQLIRAAIACGPLTAGQLLIDLVQKCIDLDAEQAAEREVDRTEQAAKAERREAGFDAACALMLA